MSALIDYLVETGWWSVIEAGIQIAIVLFFGVGAALIVEFYYSTKSWREP